MVVWPDAVRSYPYHPSIDVVDSSQRALMTLQPPLVSGLKKRRTPESQDREAYETDPPSVIDQEITHLKVNDCLEKTGMEKPLSLVKREVLEFIPQEYPDQELRGVELGEESTQSVINSQPMVSTLQELLWPKVYESVAFQPMTFDDNYFKIVAFPDFENGVIDSFGEYGDDAIVEYNDGPNEEYNNNFDEEHNDYPGDKYNNDSVNKFDYESIVEPCSECVGDLAKEIRTFEGLAIPDNDENYYLEDEHLPNLLKRKEKEGSINYKEIDENPNQPFIRKDNDLKNENDQEGVGNEVDNGKNWNLGPQEKIEKLQNDRKQPIECQDPFEQNGNPIGANKQDMFEEEKLINKPQGNIRKPIWPPWSTKLKYSASGLGDRKVMSVDKGKKAILNHPLFNSVDKGKKQDIGNNAEKRMKEEIIVEVMPSKPSGNGADKGQTSDHLESEFFTRERSSPVVTKY